MSTSIATEDQASPPPPPPPQNLIPSLPDDVALNCLARVPRSHHPILSVVSKPIHSLLSSSLFFTARSLLHSTQSILYISLRSPLSSSLLWFSLYTNTRSLAPVPPIPSPSTIGASYAAVGSTLYVIGGSINDVPTSQVWALDCLFNTWQPAPNMRVGREFSAAGVVDGKVYVMGGCVTDSWARSAHWAEAFDPSVGKWEPVPSPVQIQDKWMHASVVMDGKIYAMADRGGIAYDAREKSWECVEGEMDYGWRGRACVVDDVLYCYDYLGKIRGFQSRESAWRELKGVESELPRFLCGATMANVGGKLMVLWEEKGNGRKEMEIWCAEIGVGKKSENGELWGKIGWVEKVRTVPKGSSIVHCLAVVV
ncbi:F-box/kelch-repeat protein SKIP6 [Fagus crenata]